MLHAQARGDERDYERLLAATPRTDGWPVVCLVMRSDAAIVGFAYDFLAAVTRYDALRVQRLTMALMLDAMLASSRDAYAEGFREGASAANADGGSGQFEDALASRLAAMEESEVAVKARWLVKREDEDEDLAARAGDVKALYMAFSRFCEGTLGVDAEAVLRAKFPLTLPLVDGVRESVLDAENVTANADTLRETEETLESAWART